MGGGNSNTQYQHVSIPSNVNVQNCASWSGGALSAQFDLPVSSDLLMFMARGHITEGSLEIVSSSRSGNTVKVDVSASVSPRSLLDQIKVCTIKLKEGENGVGIFVSTDLTTNSFVLTVITDTVAQSRIFRERPPEIRRQSHSPCIFERVPSRCQASPNRPPGLLSDSGRPSKIGHFPSFVLEVVKWSYQDEGKLYLHHNYIIAP